MRTGVLSHQQTATLDLPRAINASLFGSYVIGFALIRRVHRCAHTHTHTLQQSGRRGRETTADSDLRLAKREEQMFSERSRTMTGLWT